MKFLFAIIAIVAFTAITATATLTDEQYISEFQTWMSTHKRIYENSAVTWKKFNTWKANHVAVSEHNAAAARGEYSFTLGMNQFADLTNDEYKTQVLGLKRQSKLNADSTFVPDNAAPLPDSVDWRKKNVVNAPKDQGQCGSCWAFSAVGAMEGAHALATGQLVSLAEQQLVDCVNNGANTCSAGGEMSDAFAYAIQTGGMEAGTDYPYTATSGSGCKFDKSKVKATFSSYVNVTSGDENALQAAIAQQPTLAVAIDASSFFFQLYSSGVYDDPSCKNKYDELDHGVLLVGYDVDAASQKPYWLVKNSWGGFWGQQGYIWMRRNASNQCGIATDANYPLV